MYRIGAAGRPLVLRRPSGLVATQIIIGMQRPVRIAQQLPSQEDQVGLPGTQNVLGLGRFSDHADGAGGLSLLHI